MYILLLDGYARADTLQRVMRYDNSAFLSALSARGFDVSTRSKSNYTFTEMTLPSMFHMAYLSDIPELDGVISGRLPPQPAIRNAINRSPVLDDLREHGYSIVTTATGTSGYVSIRNSDVYLDTGEMNEFEFHLIRSTWLLDFIQFTGSDFLLDQHRDRIEGVLDAIQQEASVTPDGPRFLFAHVLAPHAPHVFAVDGRVLARSDSEFYSDIAAEHRDGGHDWERGYVAELEYLNGRVVDIVDTITTHDPSAVVIVMSDHGSAAQWNPLDPNSDPTERFTNLFAARTPGHDALFGDQAIPVNVFAELFNTYFGEHRPVLQPRFFLGYDEEIADPEAGGTER
jgi:hypothetical protein